MATQVVRQEFNKFIRGYITEATELNFPPDAAKSLLNMKLDNKGVIQRRLGLELEAVNTWRDVNSSSWGITDAAQTYRWVGVNGDPDLIIVMVQYGHYLTVFENVDDDFTIKWRSTSTFNLSTYKVGTWTDAQVAAELCSFASGNGKLYVTHPYTKTLECTWDTTSGTFTISANEVQVRDFKGADDGFANDYQPNAAEMNTAHYYNLANQGWLNRQAELSYVYAGRSKYPSNAEQWQYGKYINPSSGQDTWSYAHFAKQEFGSSRAPQGHYIVDAFNKSVSGFPTSYAIGGFFSAGTATTLTLQTSVPHGFSTSDQIVIVGTTSEPTYDNGAGCGSAVTYTVEGTHTITVIDATHFTIPVTTTGWVAWCSIAGTITLYKTATATISDPIYVRPKAIGFHAGRCFTSGVEEAGYDGKVWFSRIVQTDGDYVNCYQYGDPTAEYENTLVADDGGVLNIQEMKSCHAMHEYGSGLLLFARNGVWYVYGGDTEYFQANSYTIRKVSSAGIVENGKSLVDVEGTPYYWSNDGICRVVSDKVSGLPSVENITVQTIQTDYDALEDWQKSRVRGSYNREQKQVMWIYPSNYDNSCNHGLVFDIRTNGFFPYEFSEASSYRILDVFYTPKYRDYPDERWKFMIYRTSDKYIGGADMSDPDHYDWVSYDASGHVETGDVIVDTPAVRMQSKMITTYFERTEDQFISDGSGGLMLDNQSSCTMQAIWDWSDHLNSGKYGSAREVYRLKRAYIGVNPGDPFDNGFPVTKTKNKFRGSGNAVRFVFSTTAGKHMNMLGWSHTIEEKSTE